MWQRFLTKYRNSKISGETQEKIQSNGDAVQDTVMCHEALSSSSTENDKL